MLKNGQCHLSQNISPAHLTLSLCISFVKRNVHMQCTRQMPVVRPYKQWHRVGWQAYIHCMPGLIRQKAHLYVNTPWLISISFNAFWGGHSFPKWLRIAMNAAAMGGLVDVVLLVLAHIHASFSTRISQNLWKDFGIKSIHHSTSQPFHMTSRRWFAITTEYMQSFSWNINVILTRLDGADTNTLTIVLSSFWRIYPAFR